MNLDIQDIINSVSVPALIKDDFIKRGSFRKLPNGDLQACVGGFSIVFPVEVDGNNWAFRCWHHTLEDAQSRIKSLSNELGKTKLPYFVDFVYADQGIVVNGQTYPTTRMKWINGRNIKDYICHYKNDAKKLCRLAKEFYKMTSSLHACSIAHGDLQHENILVNQYGKIFLIDYDSMFIPGPSYSNALNTTNGKDGYQHPARVNCKYASRKLDYFSEIVILLSILAVAYDSKFIDKYDFVDSDCMLFKKSDFNDILHSSIYRDLSYIKGGFKVLLKVLLYYLKKSDIEDLEPLDVAVNKVSPNDCIVVSEFLDQFEKDIQNKVILDEQVRDDNGWQLALKGNTLISYTIYLHSFPYGRHRADANAKIYFLKREREISAWDTAVSKGTIEAYNFFKQQYPESSYVVECNQRIAELQSAQNDDDAWAKAKIDNSVAAFKLYICNYPCGRHIKDAQTSIRALKNDRKTAWCILVLVVLSIACALKFCTHSDSISVPKQNSVQSEKVTQPKILDQAAPNLSPEEIYRIERETENYLSGMEAAKSAGCPINYDIKAKANSNLKKLKGNSSKYQALKNRYDRL